MTEGHSERYYEVLGILKRDHHIITSGKTILEKPGWFLDWVGETGFPAVPYCFYVIELRQLAFR